MLPAPRLLPLTEYRPLAWCYFNQEEVGSALSAAFKDNIITREKLFITTKVWNRIWQEARSLQTPVKSRDVVFEYTTATFGIMLNCCLWTFLMTCHFQSNANAQATFASL